MIGATLAQFRITAKLGEGGMGVVYRAEDTRLGREVAVKVLPPELVEDPERAARFEREGRLLATLNHPNVAQIYDVGSAVPEGGEEAPEPAADVHFLAMELVEGPTLDERLAAGSLPRAEAMEIARQIAEGLEAAHEKGIVHRDLKPQNVKTQLDGRIKILDFGLAKALEEPGLETSSPRRLAHSPTLTFQPTLQGVVLGTAAYMSPEQAKGLPADKRADVWAFGVVLYEMLSGERLFRGETATETLASVLMSEIDLDALPADTPAGLRRLVRRCLERDPRRRLHDIADARILLDEVREGGEEDGEAAGADRPPVAPSSGRRAATAAALLAVGAVAGWLGQRALTGAAPAAGETVPVPAFRQLTRLPGGESDPSLSPDGEQFLFVKEDGGDLDIFAQRVDGHRALNLTESCDRDDTWPAISPDGQWIAFESACGEGGIFVMGATGESVRRVSDFGVQPAWSPDGSELAVVTEDSGWPTSRTSESELWVVTVADGSRRQVGPQDAMAPSWSPDGSRLVVWGLRGESVQRDLFTVAADAGENDSDAVTSLVDDPAVDWAPVWSADGRWIYYVSTRGGTFNLWRLPVDPASGTAAGPAQPLTVPSSWVGRFALSADGRRVVFTDVNSKGVLVRAPFDPARGRLGGEPKPVLEGSMVLRDLELSPDGSQIVFANEDQPQQVHLIRSDGTGYRQLTTGSNRNRQGAWSPDGEWIAFQSDRDTNAVMLVRPDGSGLRAISTGGHTVSVPRWAPDGKSLVFFDTAAGGFRVDLSAGLDAPELHPFPPPEPGRTFWPLSWSPDGTRVVGRVGAVEQLVYSFETGEYTPLPWPNEEADLQIAFVDEHRLAMLVGSRVLLGDLRGGEPVELYRAPEPRRLGILSVSADGRWMAWVERTDESDIWLMSLE